MDTETIEKALRYHAMWLRGDSAPYADVTGASVDIALLTMGGAYMEKCYREGAEILSLPLSDPRGFRPVAVAHSDGWIVASGCRWLTLARAREHWGPAYSGDRAIGDLYLAALDWLADQPLPDEGAARR